MLILDMTIEGKPPSKNARTRADGWKLSKKGKMIPLLRTNETVRNWMEAVCLRVRLERKCVLPSRTPVAVSVNVVVSRGLYAFDLDGALPCLIDAVMAGLAGDECKRSPDQWVSGICARKYIEAGVKPRTTVKVYAPWVSDELAKGEEDGLIGNSTPGGRSTADVDREEKGAQ